MAVCFHYSLLFMKLWSYVQVNMWCRNEMNEMPTKSRSRSQSITVAELQEERNGAYLASIHKANKDVVAIVKYPNNLRFGDLIYFLSAPTLCYELNFPRTTRIRKRFLLKRLLEVIIGANVILSLFQQWMIPSVQNSLIPFSNMDIAKATERLLKLAVNFDTWKRREFFNFFPCYWYVGVFASLFTDTKSFRMAVLLLRTIPFHIQSSRWIVALCRS